MSYVRLRGSSHKISSVPEPILGAVPAGKPVDDDHTMNHLGQSVLHLRALRKAGVPVDHVWVSPEGANHFAVITVTKDWQATCDSDADAFIRQLADTMVESSGLRPTPAFLGLGATSPLAAFSGKLRILRAQICHSAFCCPACCWAIIDA